MICTVIQNKDTDSIVEILEQCEMAEIRLDSCPLSMEEMELCFSADVPTVATCRVAEMMARKPELSPTGAALACEKLLVAAIKAGANYVDVEVEAPKEMSKRVRAAAHENGSVFIRSYHDFVGTPSSAELHEIVDKCFYHGADIVKIATMAQSEADAARVLALYGDYEPTKLLAFCMGEAGKASRIDCLGHGAAYSYAALAEDDAAAPGQWTAAEMAAKIYGDRKFVGAAMDEDAALRMPASKSFAQRAIIAAALAEGESVLKHYSPCSDSESAIRVAQSLGATVIREDAGNGFSNLRILGIAAAAGSVELHGLNVGESGLLTRLMIPLSAQISSADVSLEGEKTLLGRPLKGAKEMLAGFGVQISDEKVPLKISGCLEGGKAEISGKHGSQLISGLLMALPLGEKNATIVVTEPKSIPYMFITLDVMKQFGVKVANEMSGSREFFESDGDWSLCTEMTFKIKAGQRYRAATIDLEGDWSAAANFLVAGAVFGRVQMEGLDTGSLQADLSIMDILMDAGASLSQMDGDKGMIAVQRAPLTAFELDASNCPDLFPIVSVLAAFCEGTSRLEGVDRLAHKESDRGAAILEMLTQMGVAARIEDNALVIDGRSLVRRLLNGNLIKGGAYTSHHDHRMAMALAVAALGADGPIEIDDKECVAKSFPDFWDVLAKVK